MAGGVSFSISVKGLSELIARMRTAPSKMAIFVQDAMKTSLNELGENVPPYPPERMGQKYMRTESLGRSMGSGFGGGRQGAPDIFEVTTNGNSVEGRYGSRLGYAEYVIGEGRQAWMHKGRWWTVRNILNKSMGAILGIWSKVADRIAAYLGGR